MMKPLYEHPLLRDVGARRAQLISCGVQLDRRAAIDRDDTAQRASILTTADHVDERRLARTGGSARRWDSVSNQRAHRLQTGELITDDFQQEFDSVGRPRTPLPRPARAAAIGHSPPG